MSPMRGASVIPYLRAPCDPWNCRSSIEMHRSVDASHRFGKQISFDLYILKGEKTSIVIPSYILKFCWSSEGTCSNISKFSETTVKSCVSAFLFGHGLEWRVGSLIGLGRPGFSPGSPDEWQTQNLSKHGLKWEVARKRIRGDRVQTPPQPLVPKLGCALELPDRLLKLLMPGPVPRHSDSMAWGKPVWSLGLKIFKIFPSEPNIQQSLRTTNLSNLMRNICHRR